MAEDDAGEKTEKPTSKKVQESRTEGMVGVSAYLSNLLSMFAGFYVFLMLVPNVGMDLSPLQEQI